MFVFLGFWIRKKDKKRADTFDKMIKYACILVLVASIKVMFPNLLELGRRLVKMTELWL